MFWKSKSEIKVVKLDVNLNEIWVYNPNTDKFPLEAKEFLIQKNYIKVLVNVITGCDICYHTIELKIDNYGHCFSAIEFDHQNSSRIFDKEIIEDLFIK